MTTLDQTKTTQALRHRASPLAMLSAFRKQEDGVLAKPFIVFTLLMLMVGGLGVDLMRYERDRTHIQYTLDRAVLAAADLDQPLAPEAVVEDYFDKAGLAQYYTPPETDVGVGYKIVDGTIQTPFITQYLNLIGDSNLTLNARSRAEESIDDIEISVILDVSGSMNSRSRLPRLKDAAKEFVDTLSVQTESGKMSMSIIPYATQVSIPDALYEELDVLSPQEEIRRKHGETVASAPYSNCINFDGSPAPITRTLPNGSVSTVTGYTDFSVSQLSAALPLQGTMHFSPWSSGDRRGDSTRLIDRPVCEDSDSREILLMEEDPTTLKNYIDALTAWGNTSLDLGMKWGTALLDPSMRTTIQALTTGTDPEIDPVFAGRPANYNDSNTLKIVVLMTDGQNTTQYAIRDSFRAEFSNVWYNPSAGVYSTYDEANDRYYWHGGFNRFEDHAYGNGVYRPCRSCSPEDEPGDAEQLTYADLWADTGMRFVTDRLFDDWLSRSTARSRYLNKPLLSTGRSTKDARTRAICDAAKAQGITVYTIGFEAPSSGQAVLKDCASSPAHYQDVNGLEISEAFRSIANSIRTLRLTQ